jgi:formiminoglutamase
MRPDGHRRTHGVEGGAMTDDLRLGELMGRGLAAGSVPAVVLIGFPSDEGVRRNGGRPGAAGGPAAIRAALGRLTPDARAPGAFTALVERTRDAGDVAVTGELERDQAALADAVAPHLDAGSLVVVLGGGHETTYGHFLGYRRESPELLNWDAHPDVRPLREGRGHSGSPFRQALEHPSRPARRYTVAGLAPQATAAAHLAYARTRGRAVLRDDVTPTVVRELYALLEAPALVSFDLDAIDAAAMPGVSAPSPGGLPLTLVLEAAYLAGRTPAVRSCDVVELAPGLDPSGISARAAALVVWEILRGAATRPVPLASGPGV